MVLEAIEHAAISSGISSRVLLELNGAYWLHVVSRSRESDECKRATF
jgi:hypothetical protein